MQMIMDYILNWPILTGHRTAVCQTILVLLAAYKGAVAAHILHDFMGDSTYQTLVVLITAYAAKFAAEHKTP